MLQSLCAHSKEQTHQYPIHRVKKAGGRSSNWAKRLEPSFLFVVQDFVRFFQRIDRFALATLRHFAQEIANRLDPSDRFVRQFHPAGFSDFESKIQPLERVNTELELWAGVRRESP